MKFQTQKICYITLCCLMIVFMSSMLTYLLILMNISWEFIFVLFIGFLLLAYYIRSLVIVIYQEEPEKEDSVEELITDLKEIEESDNPNDYNPLNTL